MTDPGKDNSEVNSNAGDSADTNRPDGGSEFASNTANGTAENTDGTGNGEFQDELPEEEELTPELVEEEAIRGDFMLRWASIFLAVLFGFSSMSDTRTLVHIRSGEHLRANGFLPGSSDPFSYALEGSSAATPAWLFDHVVSLVYSLGGATGLTLFKALLAGIAAYVLSLISLRNMPTWWSSICAVFAVCACSVDFLPITDLATVLGLTVTLLLLHRFHQEPTASVVWKLAVLTAVWCNFDPRAYLGIVAAISFAIGLTVCGRFSEIAREVSGRSAGILWKAIGASVLALLVNPSPIASLTSVVTTYTVEYPGFALVNPLTDADGNPLDALTLLDGRTEYASLLAPAVFDGFEFAYVAGLSLWTIAIVVLLLGRSAEDLPWAATLVVFIGLGMLTVHELPAASVVAAVTSGLAAQRWYRRTFRQDYSIDTMEVLFSRGGRAVTVFAFAFLGFFAVADRLPTRAPIGMGFEADLQTTMDSLKTQLTELPEDARILNTRPSQGDLLIWHGRRCFLDSRMSLFGSRNSPESILSRFEMLRRNLPRAVTETAALPSGGKSASAQAPTADSPSGSTPGGSTPNAETPVAQSPAGPTPVGPAAAAPIESAAAGSPTGNSAGQNEASGVDWTKEYERMQLTHAMVRLAPPGPPAYTMLTSLLRNPDWILTSRGPSAAFFVRKPSSMSQEDVISMSYDSRRKAFQSAESLDVERYDFAREPDFYQKYLYASRHPASAAMRDARHYFTLDSQLPPELLYNVAVAYRNDPSNTQYHELLGKGLAGPILTIRSANTTLFRDPQNADAYRILGAAYIQMMTFEKALAQALECSDLVMLRYMQAVMALRQSATIDSARPETWNALTNVYRSRGRVDLALSSVDRYLELEEENLLLNPDADELLRGLYDQRQQWQEGKTGVQERLKEMLESNEVLDPQQNAQQKLMIAQQLYNEGFPLLSLELMEDNIDLLRAIPQAEILRGQTLLEVGRVEDGFTVLNQLAAIIRDNPQQPEFSAVRWHFPVALSQLGKGAYANAVQAWNDQQTVFASFEKESGPLMQNLIRSMPLVPAMEGNMGAILPAISTSFLAQAQVPMVAVPQGRVEPRFLSALMHLEMGNLADARFVLEGLIRDGGENNFRPLAEVYLRLISEKAAEIIKQSSADLWETFEFPDKG